MKPATADLFGLVTDLKIRRGFDPVALTALAVLTLRQNLRGRRLLVLSLLFLLPVVLAGVLKLVPFPPTPQELEFAFIFNLIPHALAPLTALMYAAGIVQDEVEEQTLTYLLLRPLPRWALYITKLAVTWLTTTVLTGVFTTLTLVVIYWNTPELWGDIMPIRAAKTVALMALAQAGYCALFGVFGLATRRSLVAGLAYIIAFEGLLANFDAVFRRLTVMYYFRVLSVRWLDPHKSAEWSIDLTKAPSVRACIVTLLAASAVFVLLGAVMMMRREFRMKTVGSS
ncbi:MAG TPA: ABC transporter permease subunit [Gemmataceae bacterium]|jgi:ABC-2 type transport system permease protein